MGFKNGFVRLEKVEKEILVALFPDAELSKRQLGKRISRAPNTASRHSESLQDKGLTQIKGKTIDKTHHDMVNLTPEGREVAREVVKEKIAWHNNQEKELHERLDEWEQMKQEV